MRDAVVGDVVRRDLIGRYSAPDQDTEVPDVADLDAVAEVRHASAYTQSVSCFDTDDLSLLRSGILLSRSAGGPDEGWHLELPGGRSPEVARLPLGRSSTAPPKRLRDLVAGWTRGASLVLVSTIVADRRPTLLIGSAGEVLATISDDRVTATLPESGQESWRQWRLQLVDGTPELHAAADRRLASAASGRTEATSDVARMLGDRLPPSPPRRRPKPGKSVRRLVHRRLIEQVEALARHDPDARRGVDEGVHKMRVACRRIRALLATFPTVLDPEVTGPATEDLRWLASILGQARDPAVVHERLRQLTAEEPRNLVHGPILRRLRMSYRGRGKHELAIALNSPRYFGLRERLDQLVTDPPWTTAADAPARDVAGQVLGREFKRFRRRVRRAESSDDAAHAVHQIRKSAKRLRYAAETIAPIGGKPTRRLISEVRQVTALLGERQDTVISRAELLAVARTAAEAGEPTFTYGLLHAREEARSRHLSATLHGRNRVHAVRARVRRAPTRLR